METYNIEKDIQVFGKHVPSFPMGIKDAYDSLVEIVPDALRRSYYGLSRFDDKRIHYLFGNSRRGLSRAKEKIYHLDNYSG